MSDVIQGVLPKGYEISQKYKILLFIKHGSNAETYRVKGHDGKLYLLKLFNYSRLNLNAFDSENNLLEIKYLKEISHENILSYHDSGELIYDGKKFGFLVLDFISGETLAERLSRESSAKCLAKKVLPHPGGPYNSIPLGIVIPYFAYSSGLFRASITSNFICRLSSFIVRYLSPTEYSCFTGWFLLFSNDSC